MTPARSLTVTEETRRGELRLVVAGELDIATASELLERIDRWAVEPGSTLALDMAEVTFMDVSGMRVLLEAAQRCRGARASFVIYNPRRIATRVFSLTAVDQQLEIRFDEQPAAPATA